MEQERKRKDTFTAQGRETPGPVGGSGVETGRTRPSASDSLGTLVTHQAGVSNRATGGKEMQLMKDAYPNDNEVVLVEHASTVTECDPSRRRSALARTPPTKRTMSLPREPEYRGRDLSKTEEKRKRSEDSPREGVKKAKEAGEAPGAPAKGRAEDMMIKKLSTLLKSVDKRVEELFNITSNSRNTKVEIKDLAEDLASLMMRLTGLDLTSLPSTEKETESVSKQRTRDRSREETEAFQIRIDVLEKEVTRLKGENENLFKENRKLQRKIDKTADPLHSEIFK